ncbi:MAG: hypothetical protein AB1489_15065 [Acidobacteriota bacterium]
MRQDKGFSTLELLIVFAIFVVLVTLSVLTLAPHRRMVKTDNAAMALYSVSRQARVQAITRRQFYAVVINIDDVKQTFTLSNSTQSLNFEPHTVTLVDMGAFFDTTDETIAFVKGLPADVLINQGLFTLPTASSAFTAPESIFTAPDLASSKTFVIYFDPAGRAVTTANNNGTQQYLTFYFYSSDINVGKSQPLMRAITVYGATGGIKLWRCDVGGTPPLRWVAQR